MPGGSPEAWPYIKDIFQAIAAKVDNEPCCDWVNLFHLHFHANQDHYTEDIFLILSLIFRYFQVGENGAGHFVKMVHNGIEYGDMQLIAEAYSLLKDGADLTHDEMAEVGQNSLFMALCKYILAFVTFTITRCFNKRLSRLSYT